MVKIRVNYIWNMVKMTELRPNLGLGLNNDWIKAKFGITWAWIRNKGPKKV